MCNSIYVPWSYVVFHQGPHLFLISFHIGLYHKRRHQPFHHIPFLEGPQEPSNMVSQQQIDYE